MSNFEAETLSFPARVKVMTWNVWGENQWPERETPLVRTLHSAQPDVLLLQEVCPAPLGGLIDSCVAGEFV